MHGHGVHHKTPLALALHHSCQGSIFWGVQAESHCSSSVGGRRAGSGRRCTAASWMSPSLLPSPRLHVLPTGFQEH